MTTRQKEAIKKLIHGLDLCDDAGLCIVGMDDQLYFYTVEQLLEAEEAEGSIYDAQTKLNLEFGSETILHPAYIDSGGW